MRFLGNDPRFLAGGAGPTCMSYQRTPVTVEGMPGGTVDRVPEGSDPETEVGKTQLIYRGKSGYHQAPEYNVFLRSGQWPSAGVELETHLRRPDDQFAREAELDMRSNWFHFERDGSLDRANGGRYGYELITVPLPPDIYRDMETWTGLQNLVSPWLKSFECEETGLHVHVGLDQFKAIGEIPIDEPGSRMAIGKMLSAAVYYSVADQAFVDRVALRKAAGYCAMQDVPQFVAATAQVTSGKATGASMLDMCIAHMLSAGCGWTDGVREVRRQACAGRDMRPIDWMSSIRMSCGHGAEINQEHSHTIEFRRGKGTLHALSVHRMVELMTGIVRYAGEICRHPEMKVTRELFMEWLAETTTSEALRNLAKQTKG